MTLRAILIGLLGVGFFCGFTYFNDAVMRQTMFIGNTMPISVYGGLLVFLVVVNPLLFRTYRRLALSGRELAVILAMVLPACAIPGSGLMRTFTASIILPQYYSRTTPGWESEGVLDLAPWPMLVRVGEGDEHVLSGFMGGMASGLGHIGLGEVPWRAWLGPLAFWLVLIVSLWAALIALAVVVHRQWAHHEQLPYPIAGFANALLPEGDRAQGGVFRRRLFWIGLAGVFLFHMNNYGATWFPDRLVAAPTSLGFAPLAKLFPTFERGGGSYLLSQPIYFTVVAFAYFLASDVSLGLGIGPYLYMVVAGTFAKYGVPIRGGAPLAPQIQSSMNFGAYFGLFLTLLYTGRHYYGQVFGRALFLRWSSEVEGYAVQAARVFLGATGAFVAALILVGLDWPLALLYGAGAVMIFLVMARISAETGLFFIQAWCFPCVAIWGLFGSTALGPESLLIMLLVTMVLLLDPREALMPFAVNALKLADARAIRIGRTRAAAGAAVAMGLAVAIPATLYFQYDRGANLTDTWACRAVPTMAFNEALRVQQRLAAQDNLAEAEALRGWRRITRMSPDGTAGLGFAAGLALVTAAAAGRLRFSRWPIHPVLFLVWSTYPGFCFASSFLVGWLVKVSVTHYGGATAYQRLKPLMFGLVAGDMLGGVAPILIGLVYYLGTGELPKVFNILPT